MNPTSDKPRRSFGRTVIGLLAIAGVFALNHFFGVDLFGASSARTGPSTETGGGAVVSDDRRASSAGDRVIAEAFANRSTDVPVTARGTIIKTLPDDNVGSRHQKFIVRLANDRTVLIAHNIDLAPRVPLREGEAVEFQGDYEWNDRGGVVHWTHHDPRGRHRGGWIRHKGKKYE